MRKNLYSYLLELDLSTFFTSLLQFFSEHKNLYNHSHNFKESQENELALSTVEEVKDLLSRLDDSDGYYFFYFFSNSYLSCNKIKLATSVT